MNISISLPSEVFRSAEGLVFTSYKTPVLFQVVPPNELNRSSYDVIADTAVIGFTIANRTFTNLNTTVKITLQSMRAQEKLVSFDTKTMQ